jgi:AcrR family transcriptional regulator
VRNPSLRGGTDAVGAGSGFGLWVTVATADVVPLDGHRARGLHHRFRDVSRRACAATVALLRERPDTPFSMRAVAARSGIQHRTLRALFGSSDVLVAAACLDRLRRAPIVIDFEQHPPERVRSQFVELLTPIVDEPGFAFSCARVHRPRSGGASRAGSD